MEVPAFSSTERTQFRGAPVPVLGACVRDRVTGTLTIQTEKVVRQFHFADGNVSGALCNAKSDLPGAFLFAEKKLTKEQLDAYLAEVRAPGANLWDLAARKTSLSETELAKLKAGYALRLGRDLLGTSDAAVQYNPGAKSAATPWLPGLRFLIDILSAAPPDQVRGLCGVLSPTHSVFLDPAHEKALSPLPLTPEENGLVTVIRNNSVVSDVFSSSFLGADRITRLLGAFGLAGLIRFESAEELAAKQHEASLSPEDRSVIREIRSRADELTRSDYYTRLKLDRTVKLEALQAAFQREAERLSAPRLAGLFLGDEKQLPSRLIESLKEAFAVLSNDARRKEYDAFLASGGSGSFADVSIVRREEEILARVSAAGPRAIDVLRSGMATLPESKMLVAAFVRETVAAGLSADPKLKEEVSVRLKAALESKPPAAEVVEALGVWMEALGQTSRALDAYKRAAALAPFSKITRDALDRLAPAEKNEILVRALQANLNRFDHYALLGLTERAAAREIQAAYRDLSKQFHPDRFFQSQDSQIKAVANEVYKAIVRAYTTLKSATKRAAYDGRNAVSTTAHSPGTAPEASATEPAGDVPPKHPQAKKFLELALQAIRQGKKDTAKLNLKLGLQIEPENALLKAKLKEIS